MSPTVQTRQEAGTQIHLPNFELSYHWQVMVAMAERLVVLRLDSDKQYIQRDYDPSRNHIPHLRMITAQSSRHRLKMRLYDSIQFSQPQWQLQPSCEFVPESIESRQYLLK